MFFSHCQIYFTKKKNFFIFIYGPETRPLFPVGALTYVVDNVTKKEKKRGKETINIVYRLREPIGGAGAIKVNRKRGHTQSEIRAI